MVCSLRFIPTAAEDSLTPLIEPDPGLTAPGSTLPSLQVARLWPQFTGLGYHPLESTTAHLQLSKNSTGLL